MSHSSRRLVLLLLLAWVALAPPVVASHHRGGRISWTRISGNTVQVNVQVVFGRDEHDDDGFPGGSGPNGAARINDLVSDPLSTGPAPTLFPITSGGLDAFTTVQVTSQDYAAEFGLFGYNLFDPNLLRVVSTGADYVVCEPAVPITITFPQSGRYVATLYMWAREGQSFGGEDGLFNLPFTLAKLESIIDLTKPGAQSPENSPPSFSATLPSVLEFRANQILNDSNGNLTPGAQLLPPLASPLVVNDPDVIGNPASDILTYEIINPAGEEVPGLSIDNQGNLAWDPALIPPELRKQTCGVWCVTIRVSDWAHDHPPNSPGAEPKSSAELEFRLRINEPTNGVPTLSLADGFSQPLPPANDPITLTVPAGILATLASYEIDDPDPFTHGEGEVVSGGSRFIFDPSGGCCPAEGVLGIAAGLADVGQTFSATIRARDDDQLPSVPDRTFEVHVGPPAPATLEVKLDRFVDDTWEDLPSSILLVPSTTAFNNAVAFRIRGIRTAVGGVSIVPLTLSSSWEFPIGTPQAAPAPPGALATPAMPISGLPNPIATFRWAPELSQLGQHRLRFTVSDGQGGTASAYVDIDVRPFTIDVVGGSIDNSTGVTNIFAWSDFMRATLTSLDPSFVISFPSLPPGAAAFYSGTPVGNIAEARWRAMGVQYGLNLIPVHVAAGAQTYTGNLTVDVRQFVPSWWTAAATRVLNLDVTDPVDFAMANQGQVKHMASMAAAAIKGEVQYAEDTQTPFLISQAQADALIAFTAALPNSNNFAPCNQGQLKNLAEQFYQVFTNVGLPANGVLFPTNGQTTFPWSSATTDDRNYSPVNIGQVKALFGFDPFYFFVP